MKMKTWVFTWLSISAFATGCDQVQIISQKNEKVQTGANTATQGMQEYVFAQKAEFISNMKDRLGGISMDMDDLDAKIENFSDAAKAEARPRQQALRDEVAQLSAQLDALRKASESNWVTVRNGAVKTSDALQIALEQSRRWVSGKSATGTETAVASQSKN